MKKIVSTLLILMVLIFSGCKEGGGIEVSQSDNSDTNSATSSDIPMFPNQNQAGLSSAHDGSVDFYNGYVYIDLGYKEVLKWKDGDSERFKLQIDVKESDPYFMSDLINKITIVKDDYAYQNGWTDYNAIYREHLSGDRKREKLCDGRIVTVKDNWVWWYNFETDTLGKIRVDGSENQIIYEKLFDKPEQIEYIKESPNFCIIPYGNNDFFYGYESMYRVESGKTPVLLEGISRTDGFIYYNNYIYSFRDNGVKYDLNGVEIAENILPEEADRWVVCNGWIFYEVIQNNDGEFCSEIFAFSEDKTYKEAVKIWKTQRRLRKYEIIDGWIYGRNDLGVCERIQVDGTGKEWLR